MKILFIEDNPEFSSIVAEILRDAGHDVEVINNADDAVNALLRHQEFDLVILDIMMMLGKTINEKEAPETGIAIYKRLRKLNTSIRVLVLTALTKKDIWIHFSSDPKVQYFGKPIPKDNARFLAMVDGNPR
ncbi:MAG: response regulator [Sideroxydans sp.]|nr:response regulator [Sideroxydans sp.]